MIDEHARVPRQAAAAVPAPRRLKILSASALGVKRAPQRQYHVEPHIPGSTVTLFSGDGGTGKSLLALQLAVATVTGGKWCGLSVTKGSVLYLSAEDDEDELHRRLEAICEADGIAMEALSALQLACLAGEDATLASPDKAALKPTSLFHTIEALIAGRGPALVVLDTLADVFGGQENERIHARQFISMLRGWAIRFGTSVVVLAHPSLTGLSSGSGSSGSTAWNNGVRSRLYLERVKTRDGNEGDPDLRVLRTMKSNYGQIGGELHLRWQAGVFVPKGSAATGAVTEGQAEQARADELFLGLLARFDAEGRNVSAHPTANNFAPSIFGRYEHGESITKRGFEAAMNRLFKDRRIQLVKSPGPPSKQKDVIVAIRR